MSIFDKENTLITKEYLISKGFEKDNYISSPYSIDDRYVLQIRGRCNVLLANIFYYLDPHEFQDQYHFYIGYRVKNEIVEIWKSKAWNNIKDIIDFEICFEACLKLIDENNL